MDKIMALQSTNSRPSEQAVIDDRGQGSRASEQAPCADS